MGVVAEVGAEVTELRVRGPRRGPVQRLVRHLLHVRRGLHSQCETTQVREQGKGAALFGYTKLYGQVPGGQAEYLRVPFGNTLPIKVPGRAAGRPFRLPVRRAADRVAGASSTPPSRRAGRSRCSVSGRSVTWPRGSPCTAGSSRSSASTWCRSGWSGSRARGVTTLDLTEPRRRPRRRGARADRRPRPGLGAGRRRHGGPRLAGRASSPTQITGCCRTHWPRTADGDGRHRPAERAPLGDRAGAPRRHDLAQRRLRRYGRPAADADACSTSRSSCGWARPTSTAGCRRSSRCSPTATRSAPRISPPTGCRWTPPRRRTRPSRPSKDGMVKTLLQPGRA